MSLGSLSNTFKRAISISSSLLINDTWRTIEKCDVLFIKADGNSPQIASGAHYAPLSDSIRDLFSSWGLRTESVATPISRINPDLFYRKTTSLNRLYILSRLRDLPGALLLREWVVPGDAEISAWRSVIKQASPSLIIDIQPEWAICKAARDENVPIYDMQHGVITDTHPYYSDERNSNRPSESLPSGYLCWDEPSAEVLRAWASKKGVDVRVVGNPWFIRFMGEGPKTVFEPFGVPPAHDARPTIIISLQWGNSHCFSKRPLERFIDPSLEEVVLNSLEKYDWHLRFHPIQLIGPEKDPLRRYIKSIFGEDLYEKWMESSLLPLPLALSRADLHLTQNSTVTIEASWLGVRTGFVGGDVPKGYYHKEMEEGYASIIEGSPDVLLEWISETLSKGKAMPAMSHRNYDGFGELLTALGLSTNHNR